MTATPDRDARRERRSNDADDDAGRATARDGADGAQATMKTPLTRTVGFAINAGARDGTEDASGRWDGGVAMELRAMRSGEKTGAAAREDGVGTGMAIPRGGGARGEGDDDAGRASRSPVMILPVRGRGGTQGGLEGEFASKARVEVGTGSDARDAAAAAATGEEAEEKKKKKSESAGAGREIPPPKPKMSKAERRALQESQRAAKAAAKAGEGGAQGGAGAKKSSGGGANAEGGAVSGSAGGGASGEASGAVGANEEKKKKKAASTSASVGLLRNGVSHLRGTAKDYVPSVVAHPAVERLALNYARGKTKGARERVSALLRVLRVVVENFEAPVDATYALSLTHHLNQVVHTLDKARPMGIAMGNAVRSLKTHLARLSRDENQGLCNDGCKQKTLMHIDYFIKEKLDGALESIVRAGVKNIEDGDVIVTHGASHAVREILLRAHEAGVKFTVTVVDSRPSSEGAGILSDLCAQGIDCVFTALNGLSYAMQHATKVLIGAAACLSNGVVVSRIGSSAVAHAALEQGVPVFVAAETCKFHERVQFDAFAFNEIGAAESISRVDAVDGVLASVANLPNLSIINLTYDVVPAKCVRSIICEAGEIAPADVPCYTLAH